MKNVQLVNLLHRCVAMCNYCASCCLAEEKVAMLSYCVRLDMDCALVCNTTAILLARGSAHGKHLLRECAELCGLCAVECEKHAHMEHCKACAAICRECEVACRQT